MAPGRGGPHGNRANPPCRKFEKSSRFRQSKSVVLSRNAWAFLGRNFIAMPQNWQTIERRTIAKVSWRLLLAAAEAGFFPGMILYFTYWFPSGYRGRVISTLFIAQPVANAIGSIVSAAILGMDGVLGLKGWQWVFVIEALPAVLLAFVVLKVMTDRPEGANWLAPGEKDWL